MSKLSTVDWGIIMTCHVTQCHVTQCHVMQAGEGFVEGLFFDVLFSASFV